MINNVKKKFLWMLFAVLAIAFGSILYVFNLKFADAKSEPSLFSVSAPALIEEFTKDADAANQKYVEKIVTVNGNVTSKEIVDSIVNIKMEDNLTGNYIIFAFQDQYMKEAKQIEQGDKVAIKGSCSGGIYSEILESVSISFKRCTLMSKENQ
jgi:hypothetical protein